MQGQELLPGAVIKEICNGPAEGGPKNPLIGRLVTGCMVPRRLIGATRKYSIQWPLP